MRLRRKYNIIRSKKGFKEFIKYNLAEARRFIISCYRSPLFYSEHLDKYKDALDIDDIGFKFVSILNEDELKALKYYRYHNTIDTEPKDYEQLIDNAYLKWLSILPKENLKINSRKLGRLMKLIRLKNNISIISLSVIMDVDRNTITKYEKGERLPSLEYFYRFCIKFDLSMDEIMFSKTKNA